MTDIIDQLIKIMLEIQDMKQLDDKERIILETYLADCISILNAYE